MSHQPVEPEPGYAGGGIWAYLRRKDGFSYCTTRQDFTRRGVLKIVHELIQVAGDILVLVRKRRPQVHCITNTVAENFTANVLLAAGATPSMSVNPDEILAFIANTDGLLINLGTPDEQRNKAVSLAVDVAEKEDIPWLLDPVFAERSPVRLKRALKLLLRKPTIVRGNRSEMNALERGNTNGFGEFCAKYSTVAVSTGITDHIESSERIGTVENGHPYMAQVTAMGCAMSALIVAFRAVYKDDFVAAVSAVLVAGVCGELAARKAGGPGTYVPYFIDAIAAIEPGQLAASAKYTERPA